MVRRFFTRLLMIALLAVCGYNSWQIHTLQGNIVRLESQSLRDRALVSRDQARVTTVQTEAGKGDWLAQADLHAAHARDAIARGDFGTGQRELSHGIDDVRLAAQGPEAKTTATLAGVRHTLLLLQSQADTLWNRAHGHHPAP